MSALALPALGLARRAVSALPTTFANLSQQSIDPQVARIATSGYSISGKGPGEYVSDLLATPDLLAAHPRFVCRTANGRIFRLIADRGAISVEQGGAAGDGMADDRDTIQSAISYAEAIGAREVVFQAAHYRIDCPVRTSPLGDTRATDGHPLIVSRSITLRGAAADRTVLDFRGLDGADPEANWQSIATATNDPAPAVWRGGGLFIDGEPDDPRGTRRRVGRVELHRLILQGNREHTGRYTFPADPTDGDGWDVSDKAIWLQDCYAGELALTDVDCIGWKGEILYVGGAGNALERLEMTRCRLLTSNGSAMNPGANARIVAADCEFGDCFQAQEDTGKSSATYRNCLWRDCDHMNLGGGPTADVQYNITYPTRDDAAPLPQTVLENCEFRNVGIFYVGSWVMGRLRTVDTQTILDGNHSHAIRDVDLRIDAWVDRRDDVPTALALFGPNTLNEQIPGAPQGTFKEPLEHIRVQIRHFRSHAAAQAGRQWRGPMWSGYLKATCRIECEGDFASQTTPNGGAYPLSFPPIRYRSGEASTAYTTRGYYIAPAISGNGDLNPAGPVMAVEAADEAVYDMVMARWPGGGPGYGYAEGQIVRIVKNDDRGTIRFVKGAAPDNMGLKATRALDKADDWIAFTFNSRIRRWEESGFFTSV